MNNVTIVTPSRIHFALIDLSGFLSKIDGGIGLSLSKPGFKITAECADKTEISGPKESVQRAETIVEILREKLPISHVRLEIEENIPAHVGLGSGTQLSMGVTQAICKLHGLNIDCQEMAYLVERGGTSGIGIAAFSHGGFIVDGGHKFSNDGDAHAKKSFLPSSASKGIKPPPIIVRYDFPDWDILITIPECKHISGAEEVKLFQTLCPLPLNDAQSISHIILLKLLPAIVQQDMESFGKAVDLIQNTGWKKVEIEKQDLIVNSIMAFLRDSGAYGVGLSSWGPAIFCFGEDLRSLETKTRDFLADKNPGGYCFLTRANNNGATMKL